MPESPISQPDQVEQPSSPEVKPTSPILSTGELVFTVLTPEGPSERKIDLLWLKLTCEEAEKDHALQLDANGAQITTAAFLDDLATRLSAKVADCTPTMAWQMWISAANAMEELKNAMSGTPN